MQKRKLYLDLIKAAGACAIVALHTISNTMHAEGGPLNPKDMVKAVLGDAQNHLPALTLPSRCL